MTRTGAGPSVRVDTADLGAAVASALARVEDPCSVALAAGWSVHDLGLLVDAQVRDDELVVELTLTDPLCPFFDVLDDLVRTAVSEETGHRNVRVEISEDVAWDPSRQQRGALATALHPWGEKRLAPPDAAQQSRGTEALSEHGGGPVT
jgi:metal-sulfur cluster biosynthetic enzyme